MKLNKTRIHECGIKDQFSDLVRTVFYLFLIGCLLVCTRFMTDSGLRQAVVVGGIIGLLVHWMNTRRCFFVLDDKHQLKTVRNCLDNMKYSAFIGGNHYRLTLPRWMYFNHQDVQINVNDDMITVTGPRLVLNAIAKKILREA